MQLYVVVGAGGAGFDAVRRGLFWCCFLGIRQFGFGLCGLGSVELFLHGTWVQREDGGEHAMMGHVWG